MSSGDNRAVKRLLAILNARARVAHGKHFPLRDLADNGDRLFRIKSAEIAVRNACSG